LTPHALGYLIGEILAGLLFAPVLGSAPTIANHWLMTDLPKPPAIIVIAAGPPRPVVTRRI